MGERTSDEILMAAYQAGSEPAFSELYERHAGSIYGFLVRRLGNAAVAQDAYQEVFLRVHRARHTYDPARPFRAWLFGIAHNLLTDTLRSQGAAPETASFDESVLTRAGAEHPALEAASDSRSPEELTLARQSSSALTRALAMLPSDEATVLILARLEGLSYDGIGSILGRSAAATKQLAYRALKRVRMQMVQEGYGEKL